MPKRPLSAYNLFFREQRQELLGDEVSSAYPVTDQTKRKHRRSHGKIGFQQMANIIGKKWKSLAPDERKKYEDIAAVEKAKYQEQVEQWKNMQAGKTAAVARNEEDQVTSNAALAMRLSRSGQPLMGVPGFSGSSAIGQGLVLPDSLGIYGRFPAQEGLTASQFFPLAGSNVAFSPNRGGVPSAASMGASLTGLSDSARSIPTTVTGLPQRTLSSGPVGVGTDSEAGRLSELQRLYELRVREAAVLRQEMERNLGAGSTTFGTMGQLELPLGLQSGLADSRRGSIGSSIRSIPQMSQQQQLPGAMTVFSPGGQQHLRQAEELWQQQLALRNQGGLASRQQQHADLQQLAAIREHRARLLQQALENEQAYLAEENLQRLLRRPPGSGGL
jgi:hypothetical protein